MSELEKTVPQFYDKRYLFTTFFRQKLLSQAAVYAIRAFQGRRNTIKSIETYIILPPTSMA